MILMFWILKHFFPKNEESISKKKQHFVQGYSSTVHIPVEAPHVLFTIVHSIPYKLVNVFQII